MLCAFMYCTTKLPLVKILFATRVCVGRYLTTMQLVQFLIILGQNIAALCVHLSSLSALCLESILYPSMSG